MSTLTKQPIVNKYCEGKVGRRIETQKKEPEVYYLLAYEAHLKDGWHYTFCIMGQRLYKNSKLNLF